MTRSRSTSPSVVFLLAALVVVWSALGVLSTTALAQNPVPFVNQPLVPDATAPGGPEFTLTVNGTGFVPGAVVNWNGSALATQFVSSSQLTATVPAADISTASTASVTVVNPAPGGGPSLPAHFAVASNVGTSVVFGPALSLNYDGAWPSSVPVGDFNGDGKPDLAVVGLVDIIDIFLGDGTGNFRLASSPSAGGYGGSGVLADFNGDGRPDLAVTNVNSAVSILLGDGTGNFTLVASPSVSYGAAAIAVGDFNGDGHMDLAVANYGDGTVSILLGDGTGNFSLASTVSNSAGVVAVGDFNGDGKLDLAVANECNHVGDWCGARDTVSVFLGDGNGNFSLVSSAPVSGFGMTAADFNGDGRLDLAVTQNSSGTVAILLGDGSGSFSLSSSPTAGRYPEDVEAGDFNGDGKLDLAVSGAFEPRQAPWGKVSILLGDGTGNFTLVSSLAADFGAGALALADFDGNGTLDVAVANLEACTVSILLQVSNGTAVTLSPTSLSFGAQALDTASSPQTVTMTNTGSAAVAVASVAISGDFAQTNTCGSAVAAGASCTISVTFTPTAAGTRTGAITITDNAPGSPHVVSLTGTGIGPAVSFSTTSLSFGYHMMGTAFGSQTVTLTNTGNAALTITSMAAPSGFTQTNTCGARVEAGASCSIQVTFTPTAAGTASASLMMADNAPGSPHAMTLTGIGTATPVVVSPQYPTPLEFGSLTVGSSATLPVLLANAIDQPLTLRRLIVSPRTTFSQANNCGASLAPSLSCTIAVTFTPTAAGQRHGIAIIIDNSHPRPVHLLRLSGEAVATTAPAATRDALRPAESSPASGSPAPGSPAPVEASSSSPAPNGSSNSGQRALNVQRQAATCAGDDAKEPKDEADLDSWVRKLEQTCGDSGPQ
jgi:FG-GAP-like repeat/Abnormal spindle-like microcephaly-assoc'd, ASPM-SPD-2-Hydin/FG-GAP repeat